MDQLKNAMLKAGLITKDQVRTKPKKVKKSKAPKKALKKYHEHQVKSVCELCNNPSPDVEYYRHNNRLIVKRWLCVKCADEYKINDDLRETNQSFDARTGKFNRTWGRTKTFSK